MQLLKHFHELSLHPKNAQELKALILQLAVQGKLTANWRLENPEVEPSSVLVEKLKEEKRQLIKEKKIKNEQTLPLIADAELLDDIPESWTTVRLGEVGDWGAGSTPLRSNSQFYDGEINWFKSGELNNGIMDYDSNEKINELAIQNSSLRLNKVGDVLIAMYGATIGKTGILAVEGATNQAVCACTPFSCIRNTYLHLLLKALKGVFINQGEGGAQPNISRIKIRIQVFALPPLEEQKAIVSTVNTLFTEVEQLEELTKERIQLKEDFATSVLRQLTKSKSESINGEWAFLQEHFHTFFTEKSNIKKLRESILQLAVQGKLTTSWRKSHPELVEGSHSAKVLLERIKTKKAQLIKAGKIKKEKPLPPITKEEIPYALPEGWVWCRLQEAIDVRDGTHDSPRSYVGPNSYPLVTSKDFKNGSIDFDSAKQISQADYKIIIKRSLVEEGDILFSMIGGNIGNQIMVKGDSDFAIKNVALFKYYRKDYVLPYYLKTFTSHMAYTLQNRASGGAQPFVSLTYFRNILFPLPSAEEQKAIVKTVNQLMALCDSLEQEIEQSNTQVEQWMKSALREVFEEKKEVQYV